MSTSLLPPSDDFPYPLVPLDLGKLDGYLSRCEWRGVGYELGAKAHDLLAIPPDYTVIDCSGWVRAAVAVATEGWDVGPTASVKRPALLLPDGSVNQHDWCDQAGLKKSTPAALLLPDPWVRIAFLVPSPQHKIGHVFLCHRGMTRESWGGHGPGSRPVTSHISEGVLELCAGAVYILSKAS